MIISFLLLMGLLTGVLFPWLTGDCCPLRLGFGILRLTLGRDPLVTYAQGNEMDYLLSSFESGAGPLKEALSEKGWCFREQMGAGYIFERETAPGETLLVTGRQFTRYFRVWRVPRMP